MQEQHRHEASKRVWSNYRLAVSPTSSFIVLSYSWFSVYCNVPSLVRTGGTHFTTSCCQFPMCWLDSNSEIRYSLTKVSSFFSLDPLTAFIIESKREELGRNWTSVGYPEVLLYFREDPSLVIWRRRFFVRLATFLECAGSWVLNAYGCNPNLFFFQYFGQHNCAHGIPGRNSSSTILRPRQRNHTFVPRQLLFSVAEHLSHPWYVLTGFCVLILRFAGSSLFLSDLWNLVSLFSNVSLIILVYAYFLSESEGFDGSRKVLTRLGHCRLDRYAFPEIFLIQAVHEMSTSNDE